MLKIAIIVEEIITRSEVAYFALTAGYLNLSAYALSIKEEVEKRALKSVRQGTIVTALSRLAKTLPAQGQVLPRFIAENLAVRTGLAEIAFEKTKNNLDLLRFLYKEDRFFAADFFTVTHGVNELSIILPENLAPAVLKLYGKQKPKLSVNHLASLTVRFNEKYFVVPNIIFSLIRPLALKRINVVEIVSTYTELTFIVGEKDLPESFLILNSLLRTQK
jgi:hypothetical protein